jgi:hypothetical protein
MLAQASKSVIFDGQLTDAAAFSTLLTVESLLFAALSAAAALAGPQSQLRNMVVSAKVLGWTVAALLSAVAVSAVLMWTSVFAQPWPCDARRHPVFDSALHHFAPANPGEPDRLLFDLAEREAIQVVGHRSEALVGRGLRGRHEPERTGAEGHNPRAAGASAGAHPAL